MIRRAAAGRAVVFSSHLMQEVQALCTRAIVLRHGCLITDSPLGLHPGSGDTTVVLHWHGQALATLVAALKALDGVLDVEATGPDAPASAHIIRVRFATRPLSLNG